MSNDGKKKNPSTSTSTNVSRRGKKWLESSRDKNEGTDRSGEGRDEPAVCEEGERKEGRK